MGVTRACVCALNTCNVGISLTGGNVQVASGAAVGGDFLLKVTASYSGRDLVMEGWLKVHLVGGRDPTVKPLLCLYWWWWWGGRDWCFLSRSEGDVLLPATVCWTGPNLTSCCCLIEVILPEPGAGRRTLIPDIPPCLRGCWHPNWGTNGTNKRVPVIERHDPG